MRQLPDSAKQRRADFANNHQTRVQQKLKRALRRLHAAEKLPPHPILTEALKHQRRAVRLRRKALTEKPVVGADEVQEE